MKNAIKSTITILLMALPLILLANQSRNIRSTIGDFHAGGNQHRVPDRDWAEDRLTYHDDDLPTFFLTLPSDVHDDYYNVRFTTLYAPFYVVEAYVGLYDLDLIPDGAVGEPDMKITLWQSGGGNEENPFKYPTDLLDSVIVPFEELFFGDGDSAAYNTIDLRHLAIRFDDAIDFHICIQLVTDDMNDSLYDGGDSLCVLMSESENDFTERSGLWDGLEEEWAIFTDIESLRFYNFFISAGIGTSLDAGDVDILGGVATLPREVLIDPAYPNPFNSTTTLGYYIPPGETYSVKLYNQNGRLISTLQQTYGIGQESIVIPGYSLSSGTYLVNFQTQTNNKFAIINYLK